MLRGKLSNLKDKYYGPKPEVKLKAKKATPEKVEGKAKVKKDKKK